VEEACEQSGAEKFQKTTCPGTEINETIFTQPPAQN
jgi:hypothetical protein